MNPQNLQDPQSTTPQMPQQTTQQAQGQDPNIAKTNQAMASLAFATHLQTQLMQHQNPQQNAPVSPQNASGQEIGQETTNEQSEPDLLKKLVEEVGELRKEVKTGGKSQIEEIRSQLESLLKEEESEPESEPNTNENGQ